MQESRRLEIGGDPTPLDGYEQINKGWGWGPLPFPDNTFSEVYAAHVLEHVPWWLTQDAIGEAYRVLKPGGTLEIHTVNFSYLVECYLARRAGDGWAARGLNPDLHPMRWVASRVYSVGTKLGDPNFHLGIFDWPYLVELLTNTGFTDIERVTEPRGRQKHGPVNIGIRGKRPCP